MITLLLTYESKVPVSGTVHQKVPMSIGDSNSCARTKGAYGGGQGACHEKLSKQWSFIINRQKSDQK